MAVAEMRPSADKIGEEAVIPASAMECRLLVGATGGLGREREIARSVRSF